MISFKESAWIFAYNDCLDLEASSTSGKFTVNFLLVFLVSVVYSLAVLVQECTRSTLSSVFQCSKS